MFSKTLSVLSCIFYLSFYQTAFSSTENEVFYYFFPSSSLENFSLNENAKEVSTFYIEAKARNKEELLFENSKTLEARLTQQIYGQDYAVKETASAVIRFAAGISDPNSAGASMLYCGPSGWEKQNLLGNFV